MDNEAVQTHGGLTDAERQRIGPNGWDFSTNTNPFGTSPKVRQALRSASVSHYPDPHAKALTAAIADHEGVSPGEILIGNGSTELIWALYHSLPTGAIAVIPAPTFGAYAEGAAATGHTVITVAPNGLHFDLTALLVAVEAHHPAVTFLCSPNNPTGQIVDNATITSLANAASPGLIVVDRAYREYAPLEQQRSCSGDNILTLCSLTKAYGLAGLRLGYLVGAAARLDPMRRHIPIWSVNAFAQVGGIVALSDSHWLARTVARRARAAEYLITKLEKYDFRILSAECGFVLVDVGDATIYRHALLELGFAVRDCTSFGLPHAIRISPGPLAACGRLVAALNRVRLINP